MARRHSPLWEQTYKQARQGGACVEDALVMADNARPPMGPLEAQWRTTPAGEAYLAGLRDGRREKAGEC